MSKCLVVAGNVVDGLVHYGPFDSSENANDWAEQELRQDEWVVADLKSPGEIHSAAVKKMTSVCRSQSLS